MNRKHILGLVGVVVLILAWAGFTMTILSPDSQEEDREITVTHHVTVVSTYWDDDQDLGTIRALEDGKRVFLIIREWTMNLLVQGDRIVATCDEYKTECEFYFAPDYHETLAGGDARPKRPGYPLRMCVCTDESPEFANEVQHFRAVEYREKGKYELHTAERIRSCGD